MALILVRHTTPDVAQGTCYGRTDLDVAPSFENEAAAVANALPSFVRIVTSPLQRCRKLADYLSRSANVPLTLDARLAEMDFGRWERVLWGDVPREELDLWASDFLHARPHGGESVAMLRQRTKEALRDLEALEGSTLVVTHSGVIKVLLSKGDGAQDFSTNIDFGGFVEMPRTSGDER
ncbi:MAG: alpha-ribazole phosphatase [Pseudomonadota bacterium]